VEWQRHTLPALCDQRVSPADVSVHHNRHDGCRTTDHPRANTREVIEQVVRRLGYARYLDDDRDTACREAEQGMKKFVAGNGFPLTGDDKLTGRRSRRKSLSPTV
jgi:hypothetical protein